MMSLLVKSSLCFVITYRNLTHEGFSRHSHHPLLSVRTVAVSEGLSALLLTLLLSEVLTSQLCSEAKLPAHSFPLASFQILVP